MAKLQTLKPKRLTGRALQRLRKAHFAAHPLCVMCQARGAIRLATQLDHITALVNGGKDFDEDEGENRQGLCEDCHRAKTLQDLGYVQRARFDERGRVVW